MSTWLSGVIGQGIASQIGAIGATGPQQGYYASGQQAQQQWAQHQMSQGTLNGKPFETPKWMFNGKWMDFKEFVNMVFPEDTAEKTAFVLKYSEEN